jgi:beta-glucosidase/6-phospho-beta-glucosidase/beta-galactosidase
MCFCCVQIEGGVSAAGKGPSIWDTFTDQPGHVAGNQTGVLAVDHYHRYKQDIALMAKFGIKHYR